MMAKKKPKKKRGPKPDSLRIEGDWEDTAKNAVNKEKTEDGWPDKRKKG